MLITTAILFQRKNPNGGRSTSRAKRQRKKTDRFGIRESTDNHNTFFENLSESSILINPRIENRDEVRPNTIVDGSSQSSTNSECTNCSGQITNIQYVTLLSHMELMKKQLTRMEAKLDHYQNGTATECGEAVGTIDMVKLQSFGVPIKSKEQLNDLEEKLKHETFRNGLVSFKF